MKIEFVAAVDAAEIVAVPVFEDRALTPAGSALDGKAGGALTKAMSKGRFAGKAGQSLLIPAPAGVDADAVLLIGVGDKAKLDDLAVEAFGGSAYGAVKLSGAEVLTIDASDLTPEQAARVGFAARLAAYRFDKYRTTQKADKIASITTVRIATTDLRGAEAVDCAKEQGKRLPLLRTDFRSPDFEDQHDSRVGATVPGLMLDAVVEYGQLAGPPDPCLSPHAQRAIIGYDQGQVTDEARVEQAMMRLNMRTGFQQGPERNG